MLKVERGYAARWIKRNWYKVISCAGWVLMGIVIRSVVSGSRSESWPIGGEIFPMAACWAVAVRVAISETSARRRVHHGKAKEK